MRLPTQSASNLSADEVLNAYLRGTKMAIDNHPCTVCSDGIEWEDFPHFHGTDWAKCLMRIQRKLTEPKPEKYYESLYRHVFLYDGHLHEYGIAQGLRKSGHIVSHREDHPIFKDQFMAVVDLGAKKIRHAYSFPRLQELVQKYPDSITLIGHTDGVIDHQYLLECKALRDRRFEAFQQKKVEVQMEVYRRQCVCYMEALDLKAGFLFVKSRHAYDSPPLVYRFERDPKYFWKRAEELARLQVAVQRGGSLPKREHDTQGNYECSYCAWRQQCWRKE